MDLPRFPTLERSEFPPAFVDQGKFSQGSSKEGLFSLEKTHLFEPAIRQIARIEWRTKIIGM
jgi:hypothetical protein